MADNKTKQPGYNQEDVQELLQMLDRMQSRPRVEEVEEVLINSGRPDLVRMDVYPSSKGQEGFDPNVPGDNLADLLITPEDEPMSAEQQEIARQAHSLLFFDEAEAELEEPSAPPPQRSNPIGVLLRGARKTIPAKGDGILRTLGKTGFWLGLIALVMVAVLLVGEVMIAPRRNRELTEELVELYQPNVSTTVSDIQHYPQGMLTSFQQLYDRNDQVKGWLSFHAEGKNFLNMEYPFVQGENDTYYQNHDYDGNESDYGTLYVNADATIDGYNATDKVLIVYGNNTADQQMLSRLNRLVGPVDYARAAPEFTLTTLYRRDVYYVFAVVLSDDTGRDSFNPLQTDFADEDAFLQYVQGMRSRSLFDYPTDMMGDDSIVLLTVPTGATSTGLDNGRLVVAARRRRVGDFSVQANQIMKNKDAIMPYSWYSNRGKTPHGFYYSGQEPTASTQSTTATIPAVTLENVHGTTTTTEGGGSMGGLQIDKNPTESTDTEITDPTGTDPTGTDSTDAGDTQAPETDATAWGTENSDPTGAEDGETNDTTTEEWG